MFSDELANLGFLTSPNFPTDAFPDLLLLDLPPSPPHAISHPRLPHLLEAGLPHSALRSRELRHALASTGGTVENTYDEIAHIKIVTGMVCGLWGASALVCISAYLLFVEGVSWWAIEIVLVGVPVAQWISFRSLEEGLTVYGALRAWMRVQGLGVPVMARLRERQEDLRRCVVELATHG